MASVANDQTQVAFTCEVDAGLDLLLRLGQNDIDTIVAASACRVWAIGRQAGAVGLERPEFRDRVVGTDLSAQCLILKA